MRSRNLFYEAQTKNVNHITEYINLVQLYGKLQQIHYLIVSYICIRCSFPHICINWFCNVIYILC